ncbi:MAG: DUF3786 domain-containing protein [Actinobacteria bacterium]|nr:DUF3786 domain-containing protein [Actinomycetota bacterium]
MSDYPPEIAENLNKNYELFARNYESSLLRLAERNLTDVAEKTGSELLGSSRLILWFFEKCMIVDLFKRQIYSITEKEISKMVDKSKDKKSTTVLNKSDIIDYVKKIDFGYIDSGVPEYFNTSGKLKLEVLDSFASAIILHFLLTADGASLTGKWILYRELPDGLFYGDTIGGVLKPIIKRYEYNGAGFLKRILDIGGSIDKNFKFSGVVYPFERFPILFILEEKDEEFEADMRVLFDSSASHYLKSDIIKTLVVYTAKKLL